LAQIAQIAADFKSIYLRARPTLDTDPTQRALLADGAGQALDQIATLLNGEAGGRHLFAGQSVQAAPAVPPTSPAVGPAPSRVAGGILNTAPATNYVANGAATAFDALVAAFTPGAAPYDGVANTYPYVGDTQAYTNAPPTGGAVSTRIQPNTDLGYTVRAD